jgi:Holliday junction resolvase RusA-like endonuclease
MLKLFIKGTPIAKTRPVFSTKDGKLRTYDKQGTEKTSYKRILKSQYKSALLTYPICLTLLFLMPRPKSHYGTGRNAGILKSSAPAFPITGKDFDNLEKFVCDAMTGIIYEDDKQIGECHTFIR